MKDTFRPHNKVDIYDIIVKAGLSLEELKEISNKDEYRRDFIFSLEPFIKFTQECDSVMDKTAFSATQSIASI